MREGEPPPPPPLGRIAAIFGSKGERGRDPGVVAAATAATRGKASEHVTQPARARQRGGRRVVNATKAGSEKGVIFYTMYITLDGTVKSVGV